MMRGSFVNDEDEIEFIVKRENEETETSRAPRPVRTQNVFILCKNQNRH